MPQQVRPGEELPAEALLRYLHQQELIKDPNTEINISQFSNGFSNLTYLLRVDDREFVLRRPPFGAIKRGHDMGREYKVLSQLYRGFPQSPQAYAFTDDPDVMGAPFYVMEKIEGIVLSYREAKKRQIPAEDFPRIADRWLDTMVRLHEVDYRAVGLEDLGRPEGYVERQVSNWGKQYLKAATEDIPEVQKVMTWMEENQPREYAHRLIHNDFKYDNVVFADDSWQEISAVLDWEMCTLGDPLMDFGTSLAYWTVADDNPMIVQGWPSPTALPGNPGREELVALYEQKSGQTIHDLVFYYAFGLFKITVIVQQIYYRYQKGLTNDKRFAQLNKAARLFCTMAWQAIQKNRIEKLF